MKKNEPAPIILFVYNRPRHTQQTVEALKRNELASKSELYIYSDGPKNDKAIENVAEVREYIKTIEGFNHVTIIEREKNWGLANSIINGVTNTITEYGSVIVLEDDLVTSPYFLRYMNEGLDFYQDNPKIMSISGYNFPPSIMKFPKNFSEDIFLNFRNSSWGWGTWKDRWNLIDWELKDFPLFIKNPEDIQLFNRGGEDLTDMLRLQVEGKIDSWSIRFSYAHYKNEMYSIWPRYSYVTNIGLDGTGTHGDVLDVLKNDLLKAKRRCNFIKNIQINEKIMIEFTKFYQKRSYRIKVINKLLKILKK
ncbi:MAG TPA: glycosyltransferase [Saprospiraceae bacterium]|nr:glycosyltransferase [Saprospiraceae bacterium]